MSTPSEPFGELPPPSFPPPAVPPPTAAVVPTEAPRRLHVFSVVRGIPLRQMVGALPALIVVGFQSREAAALTLMIPAVLLVVAVMSVLSYLRRSYELAGGRIIERSGIISRTERALEIARIQQIDVERTILDRIVGTCELRLETAADSGDSELTLRVVSVVEAERLRGVLAAAAAAAPSAPPSDAVVGSDVAPAAPDAPLLEEELVRVPLNHVILAAVTGRRLVAIPIAVAALLGFIADSVDVDRATDAAGEAAARLGIGGVLLTTVIVLVLAVLVTAVTGALRDGGFVIVQRGAELQIRRGLTTTRSATVPLRRVQRVTIRRSWLHRRLGFATVTLHSAGGGAGATGQQPGAAIDAALTVPLLAEHRVDALALRMLGIDVLPTLESHPLAARRRAVVRSVLGTAGLVVPLTIASIATKQPWIAAVILAIIVSAFPIGLARYRRLASGASAEAVATRSGLLGTVVGVAPVRKVQGTRTSSSYFQRRRGLATLAVHVAGPGGGVSIHDVDQQHAVELAAGLR